MARIKITWHIKNIVLPWSSFSIFLETFVVSTFYKLTAPLIDILKLVLCNSERRAQTDS